jgi:hypothetical protein
MWWEEAVAEPPPTEKARKPVDWFDSVLTNNIESLGDIAVEYYGDYALQRLAEMMRRMTITKK